MKKSHWQQILALCSLGLFFFSGNWSQVLRSQHNIILKGTQIDPKGQNMVAVYVPIRQIQDHIICKPEFLELVIRIVL